MHISNKTEDLKELNPYIGPRPFEMKDQDLARFFGRDQEKKEIVSLIFSHPLILIYAQSGTGKTSLFNAGVVPELEQEGFEVLPLTRVRSEFSRDVDSKKIGNLFIYCTLLNWEIETETNHLTNIPLAEYLKNRPRNKDAKGRPLPRVVVFDQFEEIFTFDKVVTLFPENWPEQQTEFFNQITEALNADPLLRIVFVIREEYIAQLDSFTRLLPENLRIRFRLDRLNKDAALVAIKKPLEKTDCSFNEGVAEKLVDNLLTIQVETASGEAKKAKGEFVEPVQLQVVCQRLWQELPDNINSITHKHLDDLGDVTEALSDFYERAISEAVENSNIEEGFLRRWFERTLITPAGTRGTVYRGKETTGGLPNATVDFLEKRYIIRKELRGGSQWYELTHDRFVEPIKKSNQKWISALPSSEQTGQWIESKSAEWDRLGRSDDGLLKEVELLEAERWLESATVKNVDYIDSLQLYVKTSRENYERRRAEKQARSARRFRIMSFGLALIFFIACVFAIIAFKQREKAQRNAEEAESQAATNDSLRQDAENINEILQEQKELAIRAMETSRLREIDAKTQARKADSLARIARYSEKISLKQKAISDSLADEIKKTGRSRELALKALSLKEEDSALSIKLAMVALGEIEKGYASPTIESENALQNVFNINYPKVFLHDDVVTTVAFHPSNDSILASATKEGMVKLWYNIYNDRSLFTSFKHVALVEDIVFSPDGHKIATACWDGKARLWDIKSGKELKTFKNQSNYVRSVAMSLDGKLLVAGCDDGKVNIWEIYSGKLISVLASHTDAVSDMAFNPDNSTLTTGSWDRTVIIWDVLDWVELDTLQGYSGPIQKVEFSNEGKNLVTTSYESIPLLWNSDKGNVENRLLGHKGPVTGAAFIPSSSRLATCSNDRSVIIWDVDNGNNLLTLKQNNKLTDITLNDSGKLLAVSSTDSTVKVYTTEIEELIEFVKSNVGFELELTEEERKNYIKK